MIQPLVEAVMVEVVEESWAGKKILESWFIS
jgi:hypothetical protein